MINAFDQIVELTKADEVTLSQSFQNELDTELYFGMSNYVIKNGALSEGFEFLDDTARYYQAKREMWNLSNAIRDNETNAMEAKADLMDAEEELENAKKDSDKIRAEAKIRRAKNRLMNSLIQTKEASRQLKAFNEVRQELAPIVKAKYKSIEDYEPERWEKVLRYRIEKRKAGYTENISHVPLDALTKAKVGIQTGQKDATFYLKYKEQAALNALAHGDVNELVEIMEEQKQIKDGKNGKQKELS